MQITKSKTQHLSTLILILVGVLMWVLMCRGVATAGIYAESAHGDPTTGVNRSGTGYPVGSCAHCHDTFDDSICGVNQLMLFAPPFTDQKTGFCFDCHTDPTESLQTSMPNQYSYSYVHGGDTDLTCPDDIKQAFTFIGTTASPQSNCDSPFTPPPSRIIDESFEGPGYQETGWTETIGSGCTLTPDYPPPSVVPGGGTQSLKSLSVSTGYKAYATLIYGSEESKTFTRIYLYVDAETLANGNKKTIGALRDSAANNNVFIFRLYQSAGQLQFNLRVYNNGAWNDYTANISLMTWYRIETKYDDTDNTWEWRLNGTTKNSGSLTGTHYTGIQKWNFGFMVGSQTIGGIIYFDQFAVDTDDWVGEDPTSEMGSAHFLDDVKTYMQNKWGWGSSPNPCMGCHNPHRTTMIDTIDYPCSLASGHANVSTWEVWGDESGQKMFDYANSLGGIYQPPKRADIDNEWPDANTAPDYNTLCFDCHVGVPYSIRWNRNMEQIKNEWERTPFGAAHGRNHKTHSYGTMEPPYNDSTNYVLMCTDCHEPHGSENIWNLRTCVNGVTDLTVQGDIYTSGTANPYRDQWLAWCQACHTLDSPIGHKNMDNYGCCHSHDGNF